MFSSIFGLATKVATNTNDETVKTIQPVQIWEDYEFYLSIPKIFGF
jgi:hypothetical protein